MGLETRLSPPLLASLLTSSRFALGLVLLLTTLRGLSFIAPVVIVRVVLVVLIGLFVVGLRLGLCSFRLFDGMLPE